MRDSTWDAFVIFVNGYFAVQENYDQALRMWERPAEGLEAFCRDANPFLWDERASAETALFEGFSSSFEEAFPEGTCTGKEGHAFCRAWLGGLEGGAYGTSLVAAFDAVCDERVFAEACDEVERQLANRAIRLERTPQDEPLPYEPLAQDEPEPELSDSDIEAVIALLAKGDEAFAAELRRRLEDES